MHTQQTNPHFLHFAAWLKEHDGGQFFAESKSETDLEISILGAIGESFWFEGITSKWVKAQLDANPDAKSIRLLIDSPGGNVFDGVAIANLLKRHAATVTVEVLGEAASAASVIAIGSADRVLVHEGAMFMIHRASTGMWGFASELRTAADALDEITSSIVDMYETRTRLPRAEIDAMVTAETWLKAQRAVELGFADEVIPGRPKPAKATAANARSTLAGLALESGAIAASSLRPRPDLAQGMGRFAAKRVDQVKAKKITYVGQEYSELSWLCAKALGRPAPLTPAAKVAALGDFDIGPIVDAGRAQEAQARAKELEEAGWFS